MKFIEQVDMMGKLCLFHLFKAFLYHFKAFLASVVLNLCPQWDGTLRKWEYISPEKFIQYKSESSTDSSDSESETQTQWRRIRRAKAKAKRRRTSSYTCELKKSGGLFDI